MSKTGRVEQQTQSIVGGSRGNELIRLRVPCLRSFTKCAKYSNATGIERSILYFDLAEIHIVL